MPTMDILGEAPGCLSAPTRAHNTHMHMHLHACRGRCLEIACTEAGLQNTAFLGARAELAAFLNVGAARWRCAVDWVRSRSLFCVLACLPLPLAPVAGVRAGPRSRLAPV